MTTNVTNADSRIINYRLVEKLVEEKINTTNFKCSCFYPSDYPNIDKRKIEDIVYLFYVATTPDCPLNYHYYFEYRPGDFTIKEMNKLLKRKNDKKGVSVEYLIADKIYTNLMQEWINLIKAPKDKKDIGTVINDFFQGKDT